MKELLKERYQYIFEDALVEEILQIGQYKKIEKGFSMMEVGDPILFMPLVLDGAIKIMKEDKNDKEYLLYYLEVGDSCAMTMTCCMSGKKSNIRAVTESDTQIIMVPVQKMEDWIVKYKSWRAFVFESYDARMNEMLSALDALAFHNMEERLYKFLREKSMVVHHHELEITQHQIANDMNTSRVVISRLIKKLILDKKIETHRNKIKVLEFSPSS